MKSYIESLGILLARPGVVAHHAAMHLVAAEVVKLDPTPHPSVSDAELRALYAERHA